MLNPYQSYPPVALSKPTWKQKFDVWMVNDGQRVIFFGLWVFIQFLIFSLAFVNYWFGDNFSNSRTTFGLTFAVARASALVLHVDTGIVLFPMCRNLISWLRTTPLNKVIPFDKNVAFHKMIGWSILFFTLVHTSAHYVNFYIAANLTDAPHGWFWYAFVTGPGWTGHIMLASLTLLVATAVHRVRRKYFEVFWYTHHLFGVYFGFFSMHGTFCLIKPDRPPYCSSGGSFWKYWIASGLLYLLERIIREVKGRHRTFISKVVLHSSKVVEVQIKKDYIRSKAGQYIFLCCPEVSLYQFHPFTLTSAPEEDYISVHIRVVGNFTREFARRLGCDVDSKKPNSIDPKAGVNRILPRVMIDGPFGSASEDVFNYEVAVLVGAGIGVTPFASVLKSIWYRVNYPMKATRLRKVYFFWICRDKEAFEWFQDLLKAIEEEDIEQFIEIHTYLTGGLKPDEVRNVIINDEEGYQDALTGLRSPTHYGRPNLDHIFNGLCHHHPATDVGVFFCGPKPLGKQLHMYCNKYNQPQDEGTKFYYNKGKKMVLFASIFHGMVCFQVLIEF
ncbi:hypothetical protein K7432_005925 [Basidiobolus ranarum]|uniref:FAD-binding FR-type domain-containing protein n=1 Tax=Basidiobolus ranarum TaxID=34480 RepID=A0ABR2WVT5_9FUNG